jgi:hypothetical protein
MSFEIHMVNNRRWECSETILGGCRPVAALDSVAVVAPTGQGGGHCAVGQLLLIGPPNLKVRGAEAEPGIDGVARGRLESHFLALRTR